MKLASRYNYIRLCLGTKYVHGSIAQVVYVASGSSADWTYGTVNITFSYGVELRDTGEIQSFICDNLFSDDLFF